MSARCSVVRNSHVSNDKNNKYIHAWLDSIIKQVQEIPALQLNVDLVTAVKYLSQPESRSALLIAVWIMVVAPRVSCVPYNKYSVSVHHAHLLSSVSVDALP